MLYYRKLSHGGMNILLQLACPLSFFIFIFYDKAFNMDDMCVRGIRE